MWKAAQASPSPGSILTVRLNQSLALLILRSDQNNLTHMHTHTHACTHSRKTHARTHAYTHTHTHKHTHTNTHTHTHTHTVSGSVYSLIHNFCDILSFQRPKSIIPLPNFPLPSFPLWLITISICEVMHEFHMAFFHKKGMGKVESLICKFYLSVATCKNCLGTFFPEITLPYCWDVMQPTNQQTSVQQKV